MKNNEAAVDHTMHLPWLTVPSPQITAYLSTSAHFSPFKTTTQNTQGHFCSLGKGKSYLQIRNFLRGSWIQSYSPNATAVCFTVEETFIPVIPPLEKWRPAAWSWPHSLRWTWATQDSVWWGRGVIFPFNSAYVLNSEGLSLMRT